MAATRQLRTPHLDIAFESSGPEDGMPVVLVHGWPDDVRCWDEVTPQLVAAGCRVLAPHLRGVGPTRLLSAPSAGKDEFFRGGYERRVLEDVGHFVPREAPDEVVAAHGACSRADAGRTARQRPSTTGYRAFSAWP
jgi:pimeloyl-ACP methyl ester carboxylesterase